MAPRGDNSKKALVAALNGALADHMALYIKTKSFHWHVAGPRFRDLHLLFDEQAQQIIGVTDAHCRARAQERRRHPYLARHDRRGDAGEG